MVSSTSGRPACGSFVLALGPMPNFFSHIQSALLPRIKREIRLVYDVSIPVCSKKCLMMQADTYMIILYIFPNDPT